MRNSSGRIAIWGLFLLVFPCAGSAEPDFAIALGASLYADFEASPTVHLTRPDLFGGTNTLVTSGLLEQGSERLIFGEIYQGVGESGTSLFEADYDGSASLTSDILRVEVNARDQNNASASYWSLTGTAMHYEWLEFSGPTNPDGNYVIHFTTNLGPFTGVNTQPPGFTAIWKANARTQLVAEPLDPGFSVLQLSAFAELKQACPTLSGPACWSIPRVTSASQDVTVPGSNPVLRLGHSLFLTVRSAQANASGASLQMQVPPGVTVMSYHQVPEPSLAILQLTACSVLVWCKQLGHSVKPR